MEMRQIAINFIKTLSSSEKERVKIMLNHGIVCGSDYAKMNDVDPEEFSEELKSIFKGD